MKKTNTLAVLLGVLSFLVIGCQSSSRYRHAMLIHFPEQYRELVSSRKVDTYDTLDTKSGTRVFVYLRHSPEQTYQLDTVLSAPLERELQTKLTWGTATLRPNWKLIRFVLGL